MRIFILNKKSLIFSILIMSTIIYLIIFLYSYFSPCMSYNLNENSLFNISENSTLDIICKSNEKIAYLTFDDGPTAKATPIILDILKEEDVKATFFVVGKHVKENPSIVKRAFDEGHYIANHGYSHNNHLLYSSLENFKKELINTDLEISKAIGKDDYCSHIFRFPNGYMSNMYKSQKKAALSILLDLNYVYVDWNCLNNDSETKYSNYQLLNNLKKSSKNKGTLIILMHDTTDVNKTYEVLKDSIKYLKSEGYDFRNFYDFVQYNY